MGAVIRGSSRSSTARSGAAGGGGDSRCAGGEACRGNPDALPNHIAFDVNLDGQISEEEFRTRLTEEYDRLDRDHDGRLMRAELLMDVPVREQRSGGGGMQGGGRPPGGGGGRPPR